MLKVLTIFIFISLTFQTYAQDDSDQTEKKEVVFDINPDIQKEHADLIELIKATDSMDDDERQYWFDIMPSMTDKQISRLEEILETERRKLQALEVKYGKEIKDLNEKHLIEWQTQFFKENSKESEEITNKTLETQYQGLHEDLLKIIKEEAYQNSQN